MSFRGKLWVLLISGVISIYAVVGGLPFVGGLLTTSAQQTVNDPSAQLRIVDSVLQHIQGDPGSTVSLRVLRSGEKPQTIKVTRGKYTAPPTESRVENGKIGVVK